MSTSVSWRDAVSKEAKGAAGFDLGEVVDVGKYYVHTRKGRTLERKTNFYIPKDLFNSYDGNTVRFNVAEANADQFVGNTFPTDETYMQKYGKQAATKEESDIIERIPLMTERLDVRKHAHKGELVITKKPYIEKQGRDIKVTREEITIEEVKPGGSTKVPDNVRKDLGEEIIRIPIQHEDIDVSKTPEVRGELVIRKRPVTETHHIAEDIRSEKYEVTEDKSHAPDEERRPLRKP